MTVLAALAVVAAVTLGDRWLKRRHPRLWRKTQLPTCILATLLCLVYVGAYGWALWDTWTSPVGAGDKGVLTVLILLTIAAFLFFIIVSWRSYLRERRSWREEDAP